jgi:hypothetical protein
MQLRARAREGDARSCNLRRSVRIGRTARYRCVPLVTPSRLLLNELDLVAAGTHKFKEKWTHKNHKKQ